MDNKNNENKNDNNNNNNNHRYNNNNFTDNYGHNINPINRSNSAASSLSSNSRTYINTQPSPMQDPTTTTTTTTLQPSLPPPPPPPQYTADNNNPQISIPVNNIEREEEKICKICHESSSSSSFPPPEQSPPLSPTSSASSTKSSLEPSFWAKLFAKKHKEKNKLISPCRCKGSLQYVHLECLNQWRKSNTRSDSAYQCEVCKYRYKMYRPFIAHIIDSEIFLHLMTTVVFLLLVYLLAFLIGIIDFKWITPGGPAGEEENDWKYIEVLNLYLVHIIISLCIISCCGLLFLLYIYISGQDTTLGGLRGCCAGPGSFGSSSSSYFCCASCMFVDSDGCGACVCVLFLIMAFWIFLLGIFGVLLISYLIIKNINNYFLDRIKETILEVKKN